MLSKIKPLVHSKTFQATVVAVIAGLSGSLVGYQFAKKRLEEEFRDILDKEIIEARKFYSALHKKDAFASPNLVMKDVGLEDAAEALKVYQGRIDEVVEEILDDPAPPEARTFYNQYMKGLVSDADNEDDPAYKVAIDAILEVSSRDPEHPYIITDGEFAEGEYTQISVTYYAGDEILSDDKDVPIDDIDKTVGHEALQNFGRGSGDSRIVYVRNEVIEIDFEIALHDGCYAEVVHGIRNRLPQQNKNVKRR